MPNNIDIQNAKQIRDSMEVYCGLTARSDAALTYSISAGGYQDSNVSTAMAEDTWTMRNLADFQGEGFILDGSCTLYDATVAASLDDGKVGIRTDIGGTETVTITASDDIVAVTIGITAGEGYITANGINYDVSRMVVIPVNANNITLTFTSTDAERRLEIASILAGVIVSFDNSSLISCNLDLRADLSIVGSNWEISTIDIKAYWKDDISEAVSNIGDDVPIWYYAGYSGDYSEVRYFYLSEPVQSLNNVLTIRGEDASHKLEDSKNVNIQRLDTTAQNGRKQLYNWFTKIIQNAGIKPVYIEPAPSTSGSITTGRSIVMQNASPREHVKEIMALAHSGTFYPRYVDAGTPKITWTKPTASWTIYEADCGNVGRTIDRNIAKITVNNDSDYGVENTANRASNWTVLKKDIKVTRGQKYTYNFSEWYWAYSVANKLNNKFTISQLNRVQWVSAVNSYKKGSTWYSRVTLSGKKLTVTVNKRSIVPTPLRSGYTAEVQPLAIGKVYQGTTFIYPNYQNLFNRSNQGGSFTWKGDPRIQPRDVFNFVKLDGTVETCTIEKVQLTHEGGGTIADISYRVGIV